MTPSDAAASSLPCPRCATPVPWGDAAPGEKIKCPNCNLELIVPTASPSDAGAGQGGAEEPDEYAVRVEPEAPPPPLPSYAAGHDYRPPPEDRSRYRDVVAEEPVKTEWQMLRGAPPSGTFSSNILNFPFQAAARAHTLLLAGLILAALVPLRIGFLCATTSDEKNGVSAGALVACVVLVALAIPLLAAWAVAASVYGLTVLRKTWAGRDSVEPWSLLFHERAAKESLYVFSAAAFGALPGLIVAPLADWAGCPKSLPIAFTASLLFPLALLSMLETSSAANPVWPPLWESVLRARRAWTSFYLITVPAAVLLAFLLAASWNWRILNTILAAALLPAAWLTYFRLLGRLANFCSGGRSEEILDQPSSEE